MPMSTKFYGNDLSKIYGYTAKQVYDMILWSTPKHLKANDKIDIISLPNR